MQKDEALKIVKDKKIQFIELWFVDILGQLKSFTITGRELGEAFSEGMGFDGSSVEGFARIYESDLIAVPEPDTFAVVPWLGEEDSVARMFCDVLTPDKKPYDGDTRFILKKNLEEAKKLGYTYYVGPELEYFYFKNDRATESLDDGGYFDSLPLDKADDMRRESVVLLEKMGILVECSHHEVAPSQHEINLCFKEALAMADNVMSYKVIVKEAARKHGVYASFMPKPIFEENGSGMHVHQSLFKDGRNAMFSANDKYHLSDTAKYFAAGILRHSAEITAITNQWVNSYKRLVPGYEAPVYISWGQKNRSALVRIPIYKPGKEVSTRIEIRFPDPACNPYLAFAVMLAAGLEGIKNKYPLPEPIEKNIYHLTDEERKREGIEMLPGSLIEAINATEKSELVKSALGEHTFNKFIENKKIEWDRYRMHVSNYELDKYLPIL